MYACHVSVTQCLFLPRDALVVQSSVLRLHVVCPSVCPFVTLVDQDHISWKSWKLIARQLSQHLRYS